MGSEKYHKIVLGDPQRKIKLEIPRRKASITADLNATLCESVNWIHLPQDRDQWRTRVNTIVNLWV
jgi:hypothetical protein